MKNIFKILISQILVSSLISCNSGEQKETKMEKPIHKEHNQLANEFTHQNIVILDIAYSINDSVQILFREVVDQYLLLAEALVEGDTNKVDQSAGLLAKRVKSIPVDSFYGEGLNAWTQHAGQYEEKLKEMQHIKGLGNKRSYFAHISEIMYCTVKSFDIQAGSLYAAYCPMALDGKGAYWLTASKTIFNPYFGNEMLNCGEIKEEL